MIENEKEPRNNRLVLLALGGLLLVGLLGAGFAVMVGQVRAQTEPTIPDEPTVLQSIERIVSGNGQTIVIEGGAGVGFPFENALRQLVVDGTITQDTADSIMSDLSSRTGAVTYSSATDPNGEREITVDVKIRSNDDTLRPAMEQTLDAAVANGQLTAEQAAAILAEVDAAPDMTGLAGPGQLFSFSAASALDATALLNGPLGDRLNSGVTDGTITSSEAQTFRDVLTKLLAATE